MPDLDIHVRSLLVLGGARSGKSRYAQTLAETSGKRPVLIATAEALDVEMAERIAQHQAGRDARWGLVEEPLALAEALRQHARPEDVLVVDCLTLWLGNLLAHEADTDAASADLVNALGNLSGSVVFVSNEVGNGIVPDNALARRFRDLQGRLNQAVAESCDGVVLVTAGLPLQLKPAPLPHFRMR